MQIIGVSERLKNEEKKYLKNNEDKCIVIKTKQEIDKRSYTIERTHASPKRQEKLQSST